MGKFVDECWRHRLIERFSELYLGDFEEIYTMDIDNLFNMVEELTHEQKAGMLNLETSQGVENLKRIVESYLT